MYGATEANNLLFIDAASRPWSLGFNCWGGTDYSGACVGRKTCAHFRTRCYGDSDLSAHFLEGKKGDLRLKADSECVDAGDNYDDFSGFDAGYQPLPATDIWGDSRIVDGDGDGRAVVDIGAYEYQGD
jgi:hypothetical protein